MDAAFARRFLFKIAFEYPSINERRVYLEKHLKTQLSENSLEEVARRYELSFGELKNAIIQMSTYEVADDAVLHGIMREQLVGRSGRQTKSIKLI